MNYIDTMCIFVALNSHYTLEEIQEFSTKDIINKFQENITDKDLPKAKQLKGDK